jgi:hypothetical protein
MTPGNAIFLGFALTNTASIALALMDALIDGAVEPVAEAFDRLGQAILQFAHAVAVNVFAGDLLARVGRNSEAYSAILISTAQYASLLRPTGCSWVGWCGRFIAPPPC